MRIASILAASGIIAWLFCTLWNLPVHRSVLTYTGWMFVIGFVGLLVAPRIKQTDPSYAPFYLSMLVVLVCPMLWTATNFALSLGYRGLESFVVFALFSAWITKLLRAYVPENFPAQIMLAHGYFFCIGGLLCLVSLIPPCSALQFKLRLHFGVYWLAVGVYAFCHSLGILRSEALWRSLAGWFASAMCVVFLGSLTWAIRGKQHEMGRQHSVDELALSELQHMAEVQ